MHIADGIVTAPIALSLGASSLAICTLALKKLKNSDIAMLCSFSAIFFVASFIHIPVGLSQIHLVLIGFIGVFLGLQSFLAISIALLLQALLLGYGGLSSLGVNIIVMALPAYLVYLIFKTDIFNKIDIRIRYFLVGFLGLFFSTILLALVLVLSKQEYLLASYTVILANIPAMIIEGVLTIFIFEYIKRRVPKLLEDINI